MECAYQHYDPGKLFHYLTGTVSPKSLIFIQSFTIPSLLLIRISKHLALQHVITLSLTTIDFILPPIDSLPSPTDQLSSIVIDALDVFEAYLISKSFESSRHR